MDVNDLIYEEIIDNREPMRVKEISFLKQGMIASEILGKQVGLGKNSGAKGK